ncbi:MAG: flagellar hook-associated protein FlgK [Magnetococcales bacterium]|nr:flagellar hook-associated protein FlgK [Magnetococcales bacterium]
MAISDILDISKQGIFVNQSALMTVSHNIANVNTEGYSRQSLRLESTPGTGNTSIGGGVSLAQVTQQVDALVEGRLELGTAEIGRLQSRERYLLLVEDVFNDMDGDGFSQRLEEFFSASDSLADNPINPVSRNELIAEADGLSRYVQDMYQSLSDMALPVDEEINVLIADINERLSNLQEINSLIISQEHTSPALDLKDQRQQMILELGELIDITTVEMDDGGVQIMTSKGQEVLVDAVYAAELTRSTDNSDSGYMGIEIAGKEFGNTGLISGGELKGLLEIRDEVIHGDDGLLTKLEAIADEIRFQVNLIHSQSVSDTMYTSQTGAFDLGNDLDVALSSLVTDTDSTSYTGAPEDLARVTTGEVTFAYGTDYTDLTLSDPIAIDASMSIEDIRDAIDASNAVSAEIVDNKLVLTATEGVYGVTSDTSGILAAMGVGVLFTGSGARDMAVEESLMDDPNQVALGQISVVTEDDGSTTLTYHDADNQGALAIGALRDDKFTLFGDTTTLVSHYATVVGLLGAEISANSEALETQQAAYSFLQDVRESISGVSLEEELTDLIKFQRAFQASSKMVTMADELLQTIVSMI